MREAAVKCRAEAKRGSASKSGGVSSWVFAAWRSLRGERGAGSVFAVGVLGAILALALTLVPIAGAFVASQRAANAADAAALAAADVASGALPGVACVQATRAAELNQATLSSCEIDGAEATVAVVHEWWLFSLAARARAGPPAGVQ